MEGLVQASSSCDGGDGGSVLRISTRSIYLFVRPEEDCQDGGDVVDVRVRESGARKSIQALGGVRHLLFLCVDIAT